MGWAAFGPIGGIISFLIGAAIDAGIDSSRRIAASGPGRGQAAPSQSAQGNRNSFLVSLLVLSSAVIRADGKTHPAELQAVKDYVRKNFGDEAAEEAMRILSQLSTKEINVYAVGPQIAANMNYSQRLQLFHYLIGIARADGDFSEAEKSVLEAIGSLIGLQTADYNSIIAMYFRSGSRSAYLVLEIDESASDEEVKKAYRRMAMKYHPDKVASLGDDVRKAAEEKFRTIQEAYETIKKARGME